MHVSSDWQKFYFYYFLCLFISFLKIIFYWLCYYSCPGFSSFAPLYSAPLHPSDKPHTMFIGHAYKFFGYSISYTVHYISMAIL